MLTEQRIKEIITVLDETNKEIEGFFHSKEPQTNESVAAWEAKVKEIKQQVRDDEWAEFWQQVRDAVLKLKNKVAANEE